MTHCASHSRLNGGARHEKGQSAPLKAVAKANFLVPNDITRRPGYKYRRPSDQWGKDDGETTIDIHPNETIAVHLTSDRRELA